MIRDAFLPFALPDIDGAELTHIRQALESGWVTTGPKVQQFEMEFAACVGARHAVAVNSCTAAMHLALEAIGLSQGDEVITTPYTFAATAEVIRYFGAQPVFVDVDARCFNIRSDLIEAAITSRTRAIIPVHVAGLPAEIDVIYAIAAKHHLAVIEDAAHAFLSGYKGRPIGSPPLPDDLQHATCFSFYATKAITTGEGGMICTDDEDLAQRCRIMSLHGLSRDAWKRYDSQGSWYYEIIAPGYKYNMTDIAAAMGLAQLEKAERMRQRRTQIAQMYTAAFRDAPELQVPYERSDSQHSWHLYMLRLHLDRLSIDRNRVIEELQKRGIGASVHFIPLHIHPYYRDAYGYRPHDFPTAHGEYQRELSLPIYSKMTDQDARDVIKALLDIIQRYGC